ncbi:MAG: hypothetical protein OEZ04_08150 [Nitrospinota bacterium]|nr:hypothetical protein [Nitrospinota bacterium]
MDMNSRSGAQDRSVGERTPIVFVGFGLIAAGLVVLMYLGSELLGAYNDPAKHHFVVKISKAMADAEVKVENKTISINESLALGTAVVLLVMFAGLGVSFASVLISSGGRMLSPEVTNELAKINIKLQELGARGASGPGSSSSGGPDYS